MPTTALDLGCGPEPQNTFNADVVYGVDVRDDVDRRIVRADLALEPIPFPDDTFDFVTAHDFIEHVPRLIFAPHRRYPFVDLMSEIWRVLKPGGKFRSVTPAYPHTAAFMDPTHVNIITVETFPFYFGERLRAKMYGFTGAFDVTKQVWMGQHLVSTLIKRMPDAPAASPQE
ncbi:MAG: methyltransferase domain-containing protein [Candidatus Binataceae bacterium]